MYDTDGTEREYRTLINGIVGCFAELEEFANEMFGDDVWEEEDCEKMRSTIDTMIERLNAMRNLFE